MAITLEETYSSGAISGERADFAFLVRGAADLPSAWVGALALMSPTYMAFRIDLPSVRVEFLCDNEQGMLFSATVSYKKFSKPQTGDVVYQFDTSSGGTEHITKSIAVVQSKAVPEPAGDQKGAINVSRENGDLRVEGCDVERAAYRWSQVHILDQSLITAAYAAKLYALTKRVNNATWTDYLGCQYAAGEVLFLGVKGQPRGTDGEDWELTFSFAAQPNVSGLTIGAMTGINKKGWEYLSIEWSKEVVSDKMNMKPVAVYVHQVYLTGNFADLGIGGGT